jgi:hypothetical protein
MGEPGAAKPAGARRWRAPLGRRTWYLAIMAVIALGMIIVGGVGLLVQGNDAPRHQVASGCGLINCGASLPARGISTQGHISRAHTRVSHAPELPTPSPTPSKASTPAPAAAADISVTLTAHRERRDFDQFHDQLILVNKGGSPVSGWTVQLTLPRDEIDFVEIVSGWHGDPFDHWEYRGDTLTITADTDSETLSPGGLLDVSIHGGGIRPPRPVARSTVLPARP